MENRKYFLDKVAKTLNIESPSDWGKVTNHTLRKLGGSGIQRYYNGSLFRCLQSVYKGKEEVRLFTLGDIHWKEEWFDIPKSYWGSIDNSKNFLDKVAKQLSIQAPSDWGKVTSWRLCELGGRSLLNYYNGSLFACLQSVYKGIFIRL